MNEKRKERDGYYMFLVGCGGRMKMKEKKKKK